MLWQHVARVCNTRCMVQRGRLCNSCAALTRQSLSCRLQGRPSSTAAGSKAPPLPTGARGAVELPSSVALATTSLAAAQGLEFVLAHCMHAAEPSSECAPVRHIHMGVHAAQARSDVRRPTILCLRRGAADGVCVRCPALQSYKLRRCTSVSPQSPSTPHTAAAPRSASEAGARLPPVSDLLESLPLELRSGYSAGCVSQQGLLPPFPEPRWTGMHVLQQSCQVAGRVMQIFIRPLMIASCTTAAPRQHLLRSPHRPRCGVGRSCRRQRQAAPVGISRPVKWMRYICHRRCSRHSIQRGRRRPQSSTSWSVKSR
jgi:hypothetical protein